VIGGVLGVVIGFLGHYTKAPIERRFGNGWADLCKHAFGVAMLYPVLVIVGAWVGMDKDEIKKLTLAYWLSALSVGMGVGLGYTFEK